MERRMLGVLSAISLVVEMRIGAFGVFFTLYMREEIAASLTQVGVLWALMFVVSAISQIVWGWMSDRVARRKHFLILGEGIPGIVFLFLPKITSITALAIVLIVLQVLWSMAAPVWRALIAEHTVPKERGELMGKITTFGGIGAIIGYYIVGDLIPHYGYAYLFYFCALCMFVASVLAVFATEPEGLQPSNQRLLSREQAKTLYTEQRPFTMYTLLTFLLSFAFFIVEKFIAIYVRELGGTIQQVSYVAIVEDGVNTALMFPMGRMSDRIGRVKMLQVSLWVRSCAVLLFAVAPVWWYLFIAAAVKGVGWSAYHVSSFAVLSSLTPRKTRGTYMGFHTMVLTVARSGSSVGGPIADRFDLKMLFYSSFALCAVISLFFYSWLQKNKETINQSDN